MGKINEMLELEDEEVIRTIRELMAVYQASEEDELDDNLVDFILDEYSDKPEKMLLSGVISGMISRTFYEDMAVDLQENYTDIS